MHSVVEFRRLLFLFVFLDLVLNYLFDDSNFVLARVDELGGIDLPDWRNTIIGMRCDLPVSLPEHQQKATKEHDPVRYDSWPI